MDSPAIGVSAALQDFRSYFRLSEAQIEEAQRLERSRLEIDYANAVNKDESRLSQDLSDLDKHFDETVKTIMRYSAVVMLHTIFETQARSLCRDIQVEKNIPVKLSDFRGSPVDRFKLYLALAAVPSDTWPEWLPMTEAQKIRDCIVHVYGYVFESSPNDSKFLSEFASRPESGVTLNDEGRLLLTKGFCEGFLAHTEGLFGRLCKAQGWWWAPTRS